MQTFLQTVHERNWGDFASILGVIISLVGFAVTIAGLARSKSAAQKTAAAVTDLRQKLALQNVALDLATLISDIEEIKLLHRYGAWDAMPMRYSAVRKKLFSVKSGTSVLTKPQKSSIQNALQQFKSIAELVERFSAEKLNPPDVSSLNKLVTEQSDKLMTVLVGLQKEIGA